MRIIILAVALSSGCLAGQTRPLKQVYAGDFLIGAAVDNRLLQRPYAENEKAFRLLQREFNCVTAENVMKPGSILKSDGTFNFKPADEFMRVAEKMKMDVVGHVLVWHSQTPGWFFKDEAGNPVSREVLIGRMREYIHTVVKRYKGRIQYWDVVNEAVEVKRVVDPQNPVRPDGSPNMIRQGCFRESKWLEIIGEDFIELAFRFAREADPRAKLIYNDYSMNDAVKADFVAEHIVRRLKKKGVAIHGVGMQGHWHLDEPDAAQIERSIRLFAACGVKVHISEMDISVLPSPAGHYGADIADRYELQDKLNPYRDGAPQAILLQQAERYRELFDLFVRYRNDIERVTFWGLSDGDSWKNSFPVRGRTDYPLLFDRNYEPKPAHERLIRTRGPTTRGL